MKPVIIIVIAFVLLIPLPIFAPSHPEYVGFDTPLKQVSQGTDPVAIKCNVGLELIIKHNGSPACVKQDTAEKLEERGWGGIPPPCCKNMHQEPESMEITSQECSGTARCITGFVTKIVDGDTIHVDGVSVRFALSFAPELKGFGGTDSRDFIDTICPVGSDVLVDEDDSQTEGSFGRIIGVVYCNGVNLNSELLDAGLGYLADQFCDSSEFANDSWAQKHGC